MFESLIHSFSYQSVSHFTVPTIVVCLRSNESEVQSHVLYAKCISTSVYLDSLAHVWIHSP